MYDPQVAKEARDMMNYVYIAMLVLGALELLASLPYILFGVIGMFAFVFGIGYGPMMIIWGIVGIIVGGFGIYTALRKIKPGVVAKIDQGKYQEAYSVSSSTMTLIVAFLTGIIPGILLILGNQKLSQLIGPAAAPPPPV